MWLSEFDMHKSNFSNLLKPVEAEAPGAKKEGASAVDVKVDFNYV